MGWNMVYNFLGKDEKHREISTNFHVRSQELVTFFLRKSRRVSVNIDCKS